MRRPPSFNGCVDVSPALPTRRPRFGETKISSVCGDMSSNQVLTDFSSGHNTSKCSVSPSARMRTRNLHGVPRTATLVIPKARNAVSTVTLCSPRVARHSHSALIGLSSLVAKHRFGRAFRESRSGNAKPFPGASSYPSAIWGGGLTPNPSVAQAVRLSLSIRRELRLELGDALLKFANAASLDLAAV